MSKRVYPDILIHAQATGRHSTKNPPLAQLPKELHDILIPDPGWVWAGGDFAGQEVLILAAEAHDEPVLEAYKKGWDTHLMSTCELFGWSYPKDLKDPLNDKAWAASVKWLGKKDPRRDWSKRGSLALKYMKDPANMFLIPGSIELGIDRTTGMEMANRWFSFHPAVPVWHKKMKQIITREKIVTSFSGRPRRLYSLGDSALRQGINGPCQQGGADVLNTSIVRIGKALPYPLCYWLYGVHDASWWSFKEDSFESSYRIAQEEIAKPYLINGHKVSFNMEWEVRYVDK